MVNETKIKIFTGTANPELGEAIAKAAGYELGKCTIKKFSDGEISVVVDESVRGCDVFFIQSTCAPANDNLMEILIMTDALRRAAAKSVTAVIPYFGYARQERKTKARDPISAKLVANLLTKAGVAYEKLIADDNKELCIQYGVKGAPTLVITDGENHVNHYSVPEIKKYLARL